MSNQDKKSIRRHLQEIFSRPDDTGPSSEPEPETILSATQSIPSTHPLGPDNSVSNIYQPDILSSENELVVMVRSFVANYERNIWQLEIRTEVMESVVTMAQKVIESEIRQSGAILLRIDVGYDSEYSPHQKREIMWRMAAGVRKFVSEKIWKDFDDKLKTHYLVNISVEAKDHGAIHDSPITIDDLVDVNEHFNFRLLECLEILWRALNQPIFVVIVDLHGKTINSPAKSEVINSLLITLHSYQEAIRAIFLVRTNLLDQTVVPPEKKVVFLRPRDIPGDHLIELTLNEMVVSAARYAEPTADQILNLSQDDLIIGLYALILPYCTIKVSRLQQFCNSLINKDCHELATLTYAVGSTYALGEQSVFDLKIATQAIRQSRLMNYEQLLEAIDHFSWRTSYELFENILKNKFATKNVDYLLFARTYLAVSQVSRLMPHTYKYLTREVAGRYQQKMPIEAMDLLRDPILTILASGISPDRQQREIENTIGQQSTDALRKFGFVSAEALISKEKEIRLSPCTPIQAEMYTKHRVGTQWPTSVDIQGGTVVRTQTYYHLRESLKEQRIVLLYGYPDSGKSTCARLFAYDCIQEGKIALYFGLNPGEELADLVDRYSDIDPKELGEALQAIDNPNVYVIFDDIHLFPNIIDELLSRFNLYLKHAHLVLISLGTSNFLADYEQELNSVHRVIVNMSYQDINELVKIYHPDLKSKLGKRSIAAEKSELKDLQLPQTTLIDLSKKCFRDWAWLHTYLDIVNDNAYRAMIDGEMPRMGQRPVNEVFSRNVENLSPLARELFLEVCALSQMGIMMLHSPYFTKNPEYVETINYLVNQGLVIRVPRVAIRKIYALGVDKGEIGLRSKRYKKEQPTIYAIGYRIQEKTLAKQYLNIAERRNWLLPWNEAEGETSPNNPPKFLRSDEFRAQTLARCLISKPANYLHILYFAIVNKQHRILRRAFHPTQPWAENLRSSVLYLLHEEDSPLTFALGIRLLRIVRRQLPTDILKSFEDDELKRNPIHVDRFLDDTLQINRLSLSFKYLRIGSRIEARSYVEKKYIIRVQSLADRFCNETSDLGALAHLILELYKLDRHKGREIVKFINRDGLMQLIEKRIAEAKRPADLHKPASMFKVLSLVDYKWTLEALERIDKQPFVERLSWRIDPLVFAQVMSIFGSVSLAFVRDLFDICRTNSEVSESLIKGYVPRYITFSQGINALSIIADLDHFFAYYLFGLRPVDFWIDKWRESSDVHELISGLNTLQEFNKRGAYDWVRHLNYEEWISIMQRSLENPFHVTNILSLLSRIDAELTSKVLRNFSLSRDILPAFEYGNNYDPSIVAQLFVALSRLEDCSEILTDSWKRMSDNDIWRLLEYPNINKFAFASFFRILKSSFLETERFSEIKADIEKFASRTISEDILDQLISDEPSLAILTTIVDCLAGWVPEIDLERILVRYHGQFETVLKQSDDVSEIGNYVRRICINVPGMRETLFQQLNWTLLRDEIINEFKLTRIANLLSGLSRLSSSTVNENVEDEPTGFTLEDKLSQIKPELIERMQDEHDIVTLDRLIDGLTRGMPTMASAIVRSLDTETLVDLCQAEPRVEEVGRFSYHVFSADNESGSRLIDQLSVIQDELRQRVFNIPHLGYLAFHLRHFHNPFHTTQRITTAQLILDPNSFDYKEELIRRIRNEDSSSKIACLLHHLRQITPISASKVLELSEFVALNNAIDRQRKALTPGNIALLFAMQDIELIDNHREKSSQLADKLMSMDVIREANRANNIVLTSAAIRELGRATDDPSVMYDQIDIDLWINNFIHEFENRRKLQLWELGWCLWAVGKSVGSSQIESELRQQIMNRISTTELLKTISQSNPQNKIRLAFTLLGFWPHDDPTYLISWRHLVRQTLANWVNPLIYVSNDFRADAELIEDINKLEVSPISKDGDRHLSSLLWNMYWKWFRLYDFPS